ncbi:MAG: outer membrane beta-barrel protein [Candidatus Marinimicrobia bacterium]|nr:outer membrane beta-barrel protein [Candidatus Neomarinimicrobiota bacterium]
MTNNKKMYRCKLVSLFTRSVLISVFFSSTLSAQTTIAILEFEAKNIAAGEASTLSDRFRDELSMTGKYIVVERGKMEEVLEEQGFQQAMCTTDECVVELGQLIGVSQMVAGSIGKVGEFYSVSVRIIDVESGKIIKVITYDHQGDIGGLLVRGMRSMAEEMLIDDKSGTGYTTGRRSGSLKISARPGFSAGYSLAQLSESNSVYEMNSIAGYNAEFLFRLNIGRTLFIQPGLQYTLIGGELRDDQTEGDFVQKTWVISYFNLPLQVGASFAKKFSFYSGLFLGFKLKGTESYDEQLYGNTFSTSYQMEDASKTNFGFLLGGSYTVKNFLLDINYSAGLSSLSKTSDIYSRATNFRLGYYLK